MKDRHLLKYKNTFWFLPVIYGLGAVILTVFLGYMEIWLPSTFIQSIPELFTFQSNTAQSLYTSLVTAILTMVAISFSNIMVVLSTYSSQFSPRTLQDFIHSKITQHTLGFFTFSFLVNLISLAFLNIQGDEIFLNSFLSVIGAVGSLFAFVFFIHHSARRIQVNFLLGTLYSTSSKIIENVFKQKNYGEHENWDQAELDTLEKKEAEIIYSHVGGYIQKYEIAKLITLAKEHDTVLKSEPILGEYVHRGMPLFKCWNIDRQKLDKQIEGELVLIDDERTNMQDIEFSVEKIVEIALKAISPAINDPHSAINAIQRIGELMIELGQQYRPIHYYSDDEGKLRLILEQRDFSYYLYKSFYQIRRYGKDDIAVMHHIFQVLYNVGYICEEKYEEEIWELTLYMVEALDMDNLANLDYRHLKQPLDKIAKLYNKEVPI